MDTSVVHACHRDPRPGRQRVCGAGWYDYDPDGSDVVEQLYHEWTFHAGLHERLVASGAWEYRVDMLAMTQTNAVHAAHKTRHVRRWTAQLGADQTPPAAAVKKDEDVKGGACCHPLPHSAQHA